MGGASNGTRGIFLGGFPSSNIIDYLDINMPAEEISDFGDLTAARGMTGAASGD